MALYKLIVKNSKVVLKTINAVYLYLTGIKDVAGTGDVANNVVDWSIQHKTKTTAQWTADTTTILLDGQIGVENTGTTTYKFKIGNGVDLWAALGYAGGGSSSGVTSFNSRTGVVTSANGDYTTAQLTISTDKNFVTDDQLVVIGNTSGTNTGDETSARIGAIVNGASNYATPLDADKIGIWDVANSLFKSLTWANLKVALSSIFAPLNSVVDITSLCTITGWASFTTCVVTRIDLGNAYLVNVYISGVSNSGTASVQLDFTSSINCGNYSYAVSNGSGVNGRVLIAAGSDTIDWRTNAAGGVFTASGTKLISSQLWLPKP